MSTADHRTRTLAGGVLALSVLLGACTQPGDDPADASSSSPVGTSSDSATTSAEETEPGSTSGSDTDESPGSSAAAEVTLGEAFEFSGIAFAKGWKLGDEGMAKNTVVGLKIEKPAQDGQGEVVSLVFRKGEEEVATISCSVDQGVKKGDEVRCANLEGTKPEGYDRITVESAV